MARALTLYDAAVGKKAAVAVTGLILYGFVVVHMLGNLLVLQGADVYNHYASFYKDNPGPLWVARVILFVAVGLHIFLTLQLASQSSSARGTRYRKQKSQAATWSGKWMIVSGPVIFFFIVWHIVNFTYPGWLPGDAEVSHRDVYQNFVLNFQNWAMVIIYCVSNFFLGLHLSHGAWSLFQTLGISNTRYNTQGKSIAVGIGVAVAVANIFLALSVSLGLVEPELWSYTETKCATVDECASRGIAAPAVKEMH